MTVPRKERLYEKVPSNDFGFTFNFQEHCKPPLKKENKTIIILRKFHYRSYVDSRHN